MRLARTALLALVLPAAALAGVELGLRAAGAAWAGVTPLFSRPKAFPLYAVGESTAFGMPFGPKISFPKIVSRMLGGKVQGRPLEIVNLARPGSQTEEQYWRLLRELSLRPRREGLVLVYAGINETLHETPSRLELALDRSLVLSRISYLVRSPRGERRALDYERRLAKIVALARARGLKVVVSTLVGNVRDFAPPLPGGLRGEPALARARRFETLGRWREAAKVYEELLSRDGPHPGLLHRLGVCALRSGRPDEARSIFQRGIDLGGAKRPTTEQALAVRRAARRHGAALTDSRALFAAASPHGLPGYDLFLDAHHPNLRGYLIIAGGFARQASRLLNTPVVHAQVAEAELKSEAGFSPEDERGVCTSLFMWFCGEAGHGCDKEEALGRAGHFLALAERMSGRQEPVYRLLLALLRQDRAEAGRWLAQEDRISREETALASLVCNPTWIWEVVTEAGLSGASRETAERLVAGAISRSRCGERPTLEELRRRAARPEGSRLSPRSEAGPPRS